MGLDGHIHIRECLSELFLPAIQSCPKQKAICILRVFLEELRHEVKGLILISFLAKDLIGLVEFVSAAVLSTGSESEQQ